MKKVVKIEKLQEKYIRKISRRYMSMLFIYLKLKRNCDKLAELTSPELTSMVKKESKKVVRMSVPQDIIEDMIKDLSDIMIEEEEEGIEEEEREERDKTDYIR